MATITTSRGFSINVGNHDISYYTTLFRQVKNDELMNKTTNPARLSVLKAIQQLFKRDIPQTRSLEHWLVDYLRRPELTSLELELIRETVDYIIKGYRKLPLATYSELLDKKEEVNTRQNLYMSLPTTGANANIRDASNRLIQTIQTHHLEEGLFYHWIKEEKGFSDCLGFFLLVVGN